MNQLSKKTVVLFVFPGGLSGSFDVPEYLKILSPECELKYIRRKRTEKELMEIEKEWDSIPHLLSGKGYANQIRDDVITMPNPDYPRNVAKYVRDNENSADCILFEANEEIQKELSSNGIPYSIVVPVVNLKEEWIGRCFLSGMPPLRCKELARTWVETREKLLNEGRQGKADIRFLSAGQTLQDIINEIEEDMRYFAEKKEGDDKEMNTNVQKFYFTFGSWEGFPFHNGYSVVMAANRNDAIATFRENHPDVHENTVNCSFVYNEQEWESSVCESFKGRDAFEVLVSKSAEKQQEEMERD